MSEQVPKSQISSHMYATTPQNHGHAAQTPHPAMVPHAGFVPFYPHQGHQSLASVPSGFVHAKPSLSLKAGPSDAYVRASEFPQPAREQDPLRPSSVVRPIDLEQPLPRAETLEYLASYSSSSKTSAHAKAQNAECYGNTRNTETYYVPQHEEPDIPKGPNCETETIEDNICRQKNVEFHHWLVPASTIGQLYPAAQALHEAVIEDRSLFLTTLQDLLKAIGRRYVVPKVGDRDLDLHAFYREVTIRGGIEQVIRSARWKEIADELGLKPLPQNYTFVLRKHYSDLLFHYEQVYFFKAEGQLKGFPVPLPAPPLSRPIEETASPYEAPSELSLALKKRKRKLDPIQVFGVDPAKALGTTVTGAINHKIEEGYLVTVVVGGEKLTGVLYHVPPANEVQQFAQVPSLLEGVGGNLAVPSLKIKYHRKKRKFTCRAPRTRTGYNIYFKEQWAYLKQLYPESKGLGKKVIEMWNKLPANEKALYVERGNQEKERQRMALLESHQVTGNEQVSPTLGDGTNMGDSDLPDDELEQGSYDVSHDYHVSLDVEGDGQMPEPDEDYNASDAYHVTAPDLILPDSEILRAHLDDEQPYEMQEDEEGDPEEGDEGADGDEEEEGPFPEHGYAKQTAPEFPASGQQHYVVQDDVYHPTPAVEDEGQGLEATHRSPTTVEHQTYGHGPTSQSQKSPGSGDVATISSHAVTYQQMLNNGQIFYPHLQQSHVEAPSVLPHPPQVCLDAPSGGVVQHPYYSHGRYLYAQVRHGPTGEALGLPLSSGQPTYHVPVGGISYPPHVPHQKHNMGDTVPARQAPASEQPVLYPDGYPYPVPIPYAQVYPYPVCFPHVSAYPMHVADSQSMQFGHPTFVAQNPQRHVPMPEVTGAASASQVYSGQEGSHLGYHMPEGGHMTAMFKPGSRNL